jgi:low temperature requirement protein LtrA
MYFDPAVKRGTRQITTSDGPSRVARITYTYAHLPIVAGAGVVVQAIAGDQVLARPGGGHGAGGEAVMLGGRCLMS